MKARTLAGRSRIGAPATTLQSAQHRPGFHTMRFMLQPRTAVLLARSICHLLPASKVHFVVAIPHMRNAEGRQQRTLEQRAHGGPNDNLQSAQHRPRPPHHEAHVAAHCCVAGQVKTSSIEQLLPLRQGTPGPTGAHGHDLNSKQTCRGSNKSSNVQVQFLKHKICFSNFHHGHR